MEYSQFQDDPPIGEYYIPITDIASRIIINPVITMINDKSIFIKEDSGYVQYVIQFFDPEDFTFILKKFVSVSESFYHTKDKSVFIMQSMINLNEERSLQHFKT